MFGSKSFKTLLAAGALALVASGASAATVFDFVRITGNSAIDGSSQLSVTAEDDGTQAKFSFSVLAGAQMDASIAEIYFSDMTGIFLSPIGPSNILTQTGVSYVAGSASPGDLPSGNTATPAFTVTAGLLADNSPGGANTIQIGDLLVLGLTYASGKSFSDLLAAISTPSDFRIGLHVRSLADGESDSFVSVPTPVPLPAAGFLLIGALGGLAVLRRRSRTA